MKQINLHVMNLSPAGPVARSISGYQINEWFAIHREIGDDGNPSDRLGWVVTHIPTGHCAGPSFDRRKDAAHWARVLVTEFKSNWRFTNPDRAPRIGAQVRKLVHLYYTSKNKRMRLRGD
jgi:hypothetical protein